MTLNDKSGKSAWQCELPVFRVCFRLPCGACWDLKVSLPWFKPLLFDPRSNKTVAMTNVFNFLCSSYWRDFGDWHPDDMMHEVHSIAPMKSQFKQMNTSVADPLNVIRIFLLVHVNMARCSVVTLLSLNNYNSVCPCYNKIQILHM